MSDPSQLFGAQAQAYADFRPVYPLALFDWLAQHCPRQTRALDIACGSGQASLPLSAHFRQVIACDSSLPQLTANPELARLPRLAAHAEQLPLTAQTVDLVIVAQALHWFATPAFFTEVSRVLRPDGLFCAWCYSLLRIDPALDALIDHLHSDILGGYWPAGREQVDQSYRHLHTPFAQILVPSFAIHTRWSLGQLLGYLSTWSALQRWQQKHGRDPLQPLLPALQQAWGDPQHLRPLSWPLHFVAGYPSRQRPEVVCAMPC